MIDVKVGGKIDYAKLESLLGDRELLLGYPDGVKHPNSDIENSDLAHALHDGTATIQARPWLLESLSANMTEIRGLIAEGYKRLITTGKMSARKIGASCVGFIQEFVRSGHYRATAPNAPSTIRKKGSDVPLIDEGFLINSTTYVLRGKE